MYPYISRVLAEQHTRDLQNEATRAHRARQARLVQPSIEDTQCGAETHRSAIILFPHVLLLFGHDIYHGM